MVAGYPDAPLAKPPAPPSPPAGDYGAPLLTGRRRRAPLGRRPLCWQARPATRARPPVAGRKPRSSESLLLLPKCCTSGRRKLGRPGGACQQGVGGPRSQNSLARRGASGGKRDERIILRRRKVGEFVWARMGSWRGAGKTPMLWLPGPWLEGCIAGAAYYTRRKTGLAVVPE